MVKIVTKVKNILGCGLNLKTLNSEFFSRKKPPDLASNGITNQTNVCTNKN